MEKVGLLFGKTSEMGPREKGERRIGETGLEKMVLLNLWQTTLINKGEIMAHMQRML